MTLTQLTNQISPPISNIRAGHKGVLVQAATTQVSITLQHLVTRRIYFLRIKGEDISFRMTVYIAYNTIKFAPCVLEIALTCRMRCGQHQTLASMDHVAIRLHFMVIISSLQSSTIHMETREFHVTLLGMLITRAVHSVLVNCTHLHVSPTVNPQLAKT